MLGNEVKERFEAKLTNLQKMMELIQRAAKCIGFNGKDMNKIQLASEEALVNVISYAYPKDAPGIVEITCNTQGKEQLKIVIQDEGRAFNPLEYNETDISAPLEKRRIGGLGIFFFLQTMDALHYERRGRFNILTLVKRLHRP